MKTKLRNKTKQLASALLTTLIICTILGMFVVYYLSLIETQNKLSFRSQAWNMALTVSEAGVEEAMAHVYANNGVNLATDGWSGSGTFYTKQGKLPEGNSYDVSIDTSASINKPRITACATIVAVGPTFFGAAGASSAATVSRAVQVKADRTYLFNKPLVVDRNLDAKGNGILTDSYDSSDTNKSTNGQYDPKKYMGDKGDIATNGKLLNLGNANIYGHASTGPGGTVELSNGRNGGVGSHEWQKQNPGTIQPGWATDDSNFQFPPTDLPTNYTTFLPPTKSGKVALALTNSDGTVTYTTNYYDNILDGGSYSIATGYLTGNTIVTGTNVTLVLPNGMNGKEDITIAPGASVQLDVGGTSVSISGNNMFNYGGFAGSMIIWCAPSVTSVSLDGNAGFTGVLVAPGAGLSLNGSGSSTGIDINGAVIAKSAQLNGHFQFHYDEALGKMPFFGNYIITSWKEIKPSDAPTGPSAN